MYERNGRCHRWWDTERKLQEEIDEARNDYVKRRKIVSRLSEPSWKTEKCLLKSMTTLPSLDPSKKAVLRVVSWVAYFITLLHNGSPPISGPTEPTS